MLRQTFPHYEVNIRDDSARTVTRAEPLPLHVPIFFGYAEKGEPNIPHLGGYTTLAGILGTATFEERSKFFYHPNVFANRAAQYQQIYYVRMLPADAAVGSLVLQCTVTPKQVIQYQKDAFGGRLLDVNGDPIPAKEADNVTILTEPGVELVWSVRPLANGETITNLQPVSVENGGVTSVTYPVMASAGASAGSYINRTGYRFYYTEDLEDSVVDNVGALTYRFEPVRRDALTDTVTPIRDLYNQRYADVALKDEALDPSTDRYVNLSEVVARDYTDGLPFDFHVYADNVELIGQAVLAVSPDDDLGTNPYLINIMSGIDRDGHYYDHAEVSAGSAAVVNENVVLYHTGGSDGTMSKDGLEALTTAYLAGDVYPAISDSARYPFTHIYDSGYALAAKKALLGVFSIRDDVKIDFSTQDIALEANTAAEDQSTGAALRASILLHPESLVFGTQTIRASVYQQCGYLNDTTSYRVTVPMLLDRLVKRCMYDGAPYIKGSPKGRPNSEITIFDTKSINWAPSKADQKQKNWDTGLNYAQYCDTEIMHYADLRSIHPVDTSLLSNDTFVDYLVYLKHIVRKVWSIYVGRDEPAESLYDRIAESIDKSTNYAFNGTLPTKTVVYQTDHDKDLGYQSTVEVTVTGTMPNRVWKVIVPVVRQEN